MTWLFQSGTEAVLGLVYFKWVRLVGWSFGLFCGVGGVVLWCWWSCFVVLVGLL